MPHEDKVVLVEFLLTALVLLGLENALKFLMAIRVPNLNY